MKTHCSDGGWLYGFPSNGMIYPLYEKSHENLNPLLQGYHYIPIMFNGDSMVVN
jgi:hypothetical protein